MVALDLNNAASELGVSSATVRNWIKQGVITPASRGSVSVNEISEIKNKIQSGEIKRLRTRANKSKSENSFIPEEYISNDKFVAEVEFISRHIIDSNLRNSESILIVALKFLTQMGEVSLGDSLDIFDFNCFSNWGRDCVKNEMYSWFRSLNGFSSKVKLKELFDLVNYLPMEDSLGIVFQSIQIEGEKSGKGSYYTPEKIIDDGIAELGVNAGRFLDPCCGTGKILLRAIKFGFSDPSQIYGIELDEVPWRIARLNILFAFPGRNFVPNVYQGDSLLSIANGTMFCGTNELLNSFSVVATNPPWGAIHDKTSESLVFDLFPHIKSGESYSLFCSKCLDFAQVGGHVLLFLPDSILNIKVHSDIRKYLLDNSEIRSIASLGRCFSGVFSPVIRMHLVKQKTTLLEISVISESGVCAKILRSRFESNKDFIFDIGSNCEEGDLIDYIYSQRHITLKGNSEWALGVVTGDNAKHVLSHKIEDSEPIYKGSDIESYRKLPPRSFIVFKPDEFQQVAPERKYRVSEKIIYKFISNRLVFAYDSDAALTLNSANILIPSIEGISTKAILGVLNSCIAQFIHAKKFKTHKVLRGDLESLPIPVLDLGEARAIELLVDKAISGADVQAEIDDILAKCFNLTNKQLMFIRDSI